MKLITSRPPPPTSEFETVKQQALDSRYASARLIALASAHNSRLEHSASAPLIKATKDHYILFLIDGDAYHFTDFLANQSFDGGRARNAIRLALSVLCIEWNRGSPGGYGISSAELYLSQVRCKVYLNLEAQLRKLKDFRPEVKDGLAKFLDDFCTADGFCAVEDVGRKPQAADRKIKADIKVHWIDPRCVHILLALTHDKGYFSLLENYLPFNPAPTSQRITLVTGKSTHSLYRTLPCAIVALPSVFVTFDLDPTKTPTHPPSTQILPSVNVTPAASRLFPRLTDSRATSLCCLRGVTTWFHVIVVYPTQCIVVVVVSDRTTAAMIKQCFSEWHGVPVQYLHLQTAGRTLDVPDQARMQDRGIGEGGVLTVRALSGRERVEVAKRADGAWVAAVMGSEWEDVPGKKRGKA